MKSKAVRNLALADSAATIFGATCGSTVTYDNASGNYPVITSLLSQPRTVNGPTCSTWAFLAQDSTGSLDMFGALPGGSSYVPTAGDAISVSGTFSPYHQIPEVGTMTAITMQSSGNTDPSPPLNETVSSLNVTTLPQSTAGFPVEIKDATISGQSAGATFGTANLSLTVTDGTGSMTLYYWPTSYSMAPANLNSQTIPTGPVDVIGIDSVYNGVPGGLAFVPGTYHVFGNNGTTPYYGSVKSASNTALDNHLEAGAPISASQLYLDLTTASDHLAVVADYTVPVAVPAPVFQSVTEEGSTIAFTWTAVIGAGYQLQRSTDLSQPNWTDMGNPVTATNGVMSATDAIGTNSQQFYRLRVR